MLWIKTTCLFPHDKRQYEIILKIKKRYYSIVSGKNIEDKEKIFQYCIREKYIDEKYREATATATAAAAA